jgi:protein-tyrosine phosphatase
MAAPRVAKDDVVVNVLFVCLGNICRSPTAEAVLRARLVADGLSDRIAVDSAGTSHWQVGNPPDRRAQVVALRRGIDLSGLRARQVGADDLRRFDYVLAMDFPVLLSLSALAPPGSEERLHLFLDFAPWLGVREVPDPYGSDLAAFEATFTLIAAGVDGLLQHLHQRFGAALTPIAAPPSGRRPRGDR